MDLPDQKHSEDSEAIEDNMNNKTPIRLKFNDRPPTSQGSPPTKVKVPSIGTSPLVVKCGHTIAFDLFAKDPHREARRAKALSRDCPPCRQARAHAEEAAAADRKARRKAEAMDSRAASFVGGFNPRGRLPDGARFAAVYDAAAVRWTGTLTIDGVTYECAASSVRKLLSKLDVAYRESLLPAVADGPAASAEAPAS